MKINKNLIVGILLVLLISVLSFFAYKYYRKLKQPLAPIINAIPPDVIAYAEFKNLYELWNSQNLNNEIWVELQKIKLFENTQRNLFFLNTIINLNDEIKQIVSTQKMILSLHPSTTDKWSFLFLCNVNKTIETTDVNDFIKEIGLKNIKKIEKDHICFYSITTPSTTYFYVIEQGVFIGSVDSTLVEKSINQLNSGISISNDKNFQFVNMSSGKKVDANFYINYSNLAVYVSKFINLNEDLNLEFIKNIAKWTEFDLIIKKNKLLLNGYTSSDFSFLDVLKNEIPSETQIASVLPEKTIMFTNINFSDYATYYSNYKQYIRSNEKVLDYDKELNKLNLAVKFNLRDNFIKWMGKSYAMAVVNNDTDDNYAAYVICNTSDSHLADSCLKEIAIASQFGSNSLISNKIILPSLLKLLLGDLCQSYPEVWFETAGNYVVFAQSEASLKAYKEQISNGEMLANSKKYADFISSNTLHSNVYTYFNLANSQDFIKHMLKTQYTTVFESVLGNLHSFSQFSMQISNIDKRFYTNINLAFSKNDKVIQDVLPKEEKVSDGSELSFDNKLVLQAFLVKNSNDKKPNILVFDVMNNMYCIDYEFNIKWKFALDGKILSKIYEVEYSKKSKNTYLFNTENSIYLIDENGKIIENYPVKLPKKATAGLCLIDYEKKKDYRILIPINDKKLICFNLKGDIIKDFNSPALKEAIVNTTQHIVFGGKDNILVNDKMGNFKILDRKGNERLKLKSPFYKNPSAKFYYDGRYLLTSDITNTIRFISTKAEVESKTFKNISANAMFFYEDFNNDGTKDFIFISENQLVVLRKDAKEIYKYSFKSKVFADAKFYENTIRGRLMVVLGIDNQIYVFNKKGLLDESLAFKGESFPVIAVFNDKKQLNLITISGNKLLKYTLQ